MEGSFCRQPFMGEGRIIPELRRTKRRIFKEWVVTFPERVPYMSCLSEACHSSSLSCLYRACHRTCHSSRFTTETGNLKAYDVETESHWNNGISGSFGPCQARGRALELHQTPWGRRPLPLCSLPTQPTPLPLKRLCLLNLYVVEDGQRSILHTTCSWHWAVAPCTKRKEGSGRLCA